MADYTALVETGEALVELLRENLTPEPISNKELISLCSPHESENNQITVYLFQVEEDHYNNQAGFYQYSKDVQKARPTHCQLSFLITAHSKAPAQMKEADQYRMIGAVMQIIKDHPVIDREYIKGSLLETDEELHMSLERPNLDQLIKIWNNTTVPYKLSIVVKVGAIAIDSKRTRRIRRVTEADINIERKDDV